jgi:hypothetical protein
MRKIIPCLFLILLFFSACHSKQQKENRINNENQKSKPNIIVIVADDHALKVTGSYGNKLINTPNIDKLAEEGITLPEHTAIPPFAVHRDSRCLQENTRMPLV